LAVDGSYVYFTNGNFGSGTIGRANLDGSDVNQSFIAGVNAQYGITVPNRGSSVSLSPPSITADGSSTSVATFTARDA
jgi:hypothetical protein